MTSPANTNLDFESNWIQCDQCIARASFYAAKLINKANTPFLYFCGYHARKNKEALNSEGWVFAFTNNTSELVETDRELYDWLKGLADVY